MKRLLLRVVGGFLLVLIPARATVAEMIYFGGTDNSGAGVIWRANADGSNRQVVRDGLAGGPLQLALDSVNGQIYWAGGGINRMNLDGTRLQTIVSGLVAEWGVAVDPIGGKVYWTDRDLDTVQRANLDGSGIQTVLSGLSQPRNLALDVQGNKLYLAQNGDAGGPQAVLRADLDGTHLELLATGSRPSGVELDLVNEALYWTDYGSATIERSNLDGSDRHVLLSGVGGPGGPSLDLDGGLIYWTQQTDSTIHRANLDGTNNVTLLTMPGTTLKDVVLVRTTNAVPEPSTFAALLGMGVIGLAARCFRSRRSRNGKKTTAAGCQG